ncbi:helix-turn-helix transcriptional regulator [Ferrimicrobium sp.]|uniref:helix-turn-helix transcriptional regulator n=1 Tax=Ferrimicrobium sp. TaxID=2926050 RepID=UPI00261E17BD|nr:helix-turn-helix transcriptional regulator [Ferrimicrobium sp.]
MAFNVADASRGVLGTYVWEARFISGLSQNELARRSGVSQSKISRIERGEIEPSFPVLQKILSGAGLEARVYLVAYDDHDQVLSNLYDAMSDDERRQADERQTRNRAMFQQISAETA